MWKNFFVLYSMQIYLYHFFLAELALRLGESIENQWISLLNWHNLISMKSNDIRLTRSAREFNLLFLLVQNSRGESKKVLSAFTYIYLELFCSHPLKFSETIWTALNNYKRGFLKFHTDLFNITTTFFTWTLLLTLGKPAVTHSNYWRWTCNYKTDLASTEQFIRSCECYTTRFIKGRQTDRLL